jgi:hypothetical protein
MDLNPTSAQLTMYIEYLSQHLRSPQSVKNYLSAVNFIHRHFGLDCHAMQSHQVLNMLRAVNHTLRSPVIPTMPVSLPLLHNIIQACHQLGTWGLVVKCAFLFCFFGFLRQSNVAPRSPQLLDVTRDTLRTDVQASPRGLLLTLKWSKTHQGAHQPIYIPLPLIRGSSLCPTRAFHQMCTAFPSTSSTTPLLIYSSPTKLHTIVTSRMLSRQLHRILRTLQLPPSRYTLHSFRKGGATLCHSLGISVEKIKLHGTWTSDSVFTYITPSHNPHSDIPAAMSQAALAHIHQ